MQRIRLLKKSLYLSATILLLIGMLPLSAMVGIGSVFADDGNAPDASEPLPVEKDAPGQEAALESDDLNVGPDTVNGGSSPDQETINPDEDELQIGLDEHAGLSTDEALDQSPEMETDDQGQQATGQDEKPQESDASPAAKESPAEIIEVLNDQGVTLLDDQGQAIPLASQQAMQVLSGSDPFFWDPIESRWVGYALSDTGCPANVFCIQSDTPFQSAVSNAPAGSTIYVAQGHYEEDVEISTPNLSFVGFSFIDVPLDFMDITPTYSGFATVKSIDLKADFGFSSGVYANSVIVSTGGFLEDALHLVNSGGTIDARVILKSAGSGNYRIHDANHNATSFVWECAEPKVNIYPDRNYRMTFKDALNEDILNYFLSHGENPLELTPEERISNLLVGINLANQSKPSSWSAQDEERVVWHLLGHTKDINGNTIPLNTKQQKLYDDIINGVYQFGQDGFEQKFGLWFLWPTQEGNTSVSPANRQLTLIAYQIPQVVGCMDPNMHNYDPNANVSGNCVEVCAYDNSLPADSPNCHGPSDDDDPIDLDDPIEEEPVTDPVDDPAPNQGGGNLPAGVVVAALVPSGAAPIIPVTAPVTDAEQAVLMPVTGVDLGAGAWQQLLRDLSLFFFGAAILLEGLQRKNRK